VAKERKGMLIVMDEHETLVAAITMQALVEIHQRKQKPIYEPVVYERVVQYVQDWEKKIDISPADFLHALAILKAGRHIIRCKWTVPQLKVPYKMPCLLPTRQGIADTKKSRDTLHKVMNNGAS